MLFHDTHAHLDLLCERLGYLPPRDALDPDITLSVDARAELTRLLAQHELVIHATVDTKNAATVAGLFDFHPAVKVLIGAHPEIITTNFDVAGFVAEQDNFVQQQIAAQALGTKFVGIGECGLDYFYSQDTEIIQRQHQLFHAQIALAVRTQLPLIIHCRDAFADMFAILDEYPLIHGRFLVHCFTGDAQDMRQVVKRGGYLGIGGICTFNKKAEALQDAIRQAPDTALMLETDLPFLAPTPHRGKVCLPEYISHVADTVAQLQSTSAHAIWKTSRENVDKLFFGKE